MDLVIDRTKWLRGGKEDSLLLSADSGKMCCLGFLARQCGYSAKDIRGFATPSSMGKTSKLIPGLVKTEWGGVHNTPLCYRLIDINDNLKLSDSQREKRLTRWFKHLKVDVSFVD